MKKFMKIIKEWWFTIVALSLVFIYLTCFCTAEVSGSSMFPTYQNGDFLLIYKTIDVDYGDIVAIDSDILSKILCKRVIGLEGDNIVINSEGIKRNGQFIDEPYIDLGDWYNSYDVNIVVDKDSLFVMGDNRLHSTDSRELGCLSKYAVHGVSILNFTRTFGITRQRLGQVTLLFWILCFLATIFGKKRRSEEEG